MCKQGRRRLELFGEDRNIRRGWVTLGRSLSSTNFNAEAYAAYFKSDKPHRDHNGKPTPDAPQLVGTTPEIEQLRPRSPTARTVSQALPTPPSAVAEEIVEWLAPKEGDNPEDA